MMMMMICSLFFIWLLPDCVGIWCWRYYLKSNFQNQFTSALFSFFVLPSLIFDCPYVFFPPFSGLTPEGSIFPPLLFLKAASSKYCLVGFFFPLYFPFFVWFFLSFTFDNMVWFAQHSFVHGLSLSLIVQLTKAFKLNVFFSLFAVSLKIIKTHIHVSNIHPPKLEQNASNTFSLHIFHILLAPCFIFCVFALSRKESHPTKCSIM